MAAITEVFCQLRITSTLSYAVDLELHMGGLLWAQWQLGAGDILIQDGFYYNAETKFEATFKRTGSSEFQPVTKGSGIQAILASSSMMIDLGTSDETFGDPLALGEHKKMKITNIEYNVEFDDYDITCTTCGMCYMAATESEAQNKLFNHLKSDHSHTNG